jgi:hypothetical protein
VHGLGPALEAELQAFEMIFEAQRAIAGRIDRQPRGFVDHQGLAVEEEYAFTMHPPPLPV